MIHNGRPAMGESNRMRDLGVCASRRASDLCTQGEEIVNEHAHTRNNRPEETYVLP